MICRNSNKRWSYGSHRWTRPSQPDMKLCFGFCVSNFLLILSDFLLTRETDTKKLSNFATLHFLIIIKFTVVPKKAIWHFFGQFYHSRIEVLQNCSDSFVLFSLIRENLRELIENSNTKSEPIKVNGLSQISLRINSNITYHSPMSDNSRFFS